MVKIALGTSDWRRADADEPNILVRNRYYEQNPTNLEEQASLLSRPGLKRMLSVGEGPIRAIYSQPGSFDDALFVVSYDTLYRVDTDETITTIGSGIFGDSLRGNPSMAATANIGTTPEYLYIADGRVLWLYMDNAYSRGTLTVDGTIANNDKIKIGTTYYLWTSGSVDASSPAGTNANPWRVALGASNAEALENMYLALSADGVAGTTYSTALTAHTSVQGELYTSTILVVRALTAGVAGDSIATTVETGADLTWGAATLEDGGTDSLTQVQVPDDVGVVSVGFVAGYVIVVIAQGFDVNGRFYWIEPGETTIDPLNFATAERSPDPVHSVRVVGDQFWLLGTNSTEVWYPTGDPITPFSRVQGRLFDRGIWEGTDVQIKDSVIVVDTDGVVYNIGSSPQRVSDHSIEERIRKSMIEQAKHL